MTEYEITLEDSTEPVRVIRHHVNIEWDIESEGLLIIETQYDELNSSWKFDDWKDAEFVAGELNMDEDDLMEECIKIICK